MRLRLVFLLKSSESVEWGNAMNEPQTTFLAYGKCSMLYKQQKRESKRRSNRVEWMDWIHSRCVDNSRLGVAFVLRRLFTEQSRFFVVGHRETQKTSNREHPAESGQRQTDPVRSTSTLDGTPPLPLPHTL